MKDCINMFNKMMYGSGAIIPGLTMNMSGILLLIIGGITAGIGLLYNNIMIIIGSMLLSPIGDSIIRLALGYLYWKPNTTMITDGIIGIIAQFSMSILIGYIMGITNKEYSEPLKMPTTEMNNRVKPRNYIKDFILALLMGFILGYSLIYTNSTALVGLRLSLAVLPALVNGGLYIAMAHYEKDNDKYNEYMYNGAKMVGLVSIYTIGVLFTTIIGFYMFC
jgi:uncharacterized membrane protein